MREQLRSNTVAIVSPFAAFSALSYNTWRNEATERNRNIRTAGFELLSEIGLLQQIVFYAHYNQGDQRGDACMGRADVLTISDLAALKPAAVSRDVQQLHPKKHDSLLHVAAAGGTSRMPPAQ